MRVGRREPLDEALREQLRPDIDVLDAYAEEHPGAFGGCWWEGNDFTYAFVQADQHKPAMHALVDHPDRIHVVDVARSYAELDALKERVGEDFDAGTWGRIDALMLGVDHPENVVYINVHPLDGDLATRLVGHYVHVSVYHWRNGGRPEDE